MSGKFSIDPDGAVLGAPASMPAGLVPDNSPLPASRKKEELGLLNALLSAVSQGATLGAGEEISAGVNAPFLKKDTESLMQAYDRLLAENRSFNQQAKEEHPIAYPLVEGAASMAPMAFFPGVGGAVASGAIQGFASGEDGDRLKNAASGAALGALAPVLARGGEAATSAMGKLGGFFASAGDKINTAGEKVAKLAKSVSPSLYDFLPEKPLPPNVGGRAGELLELATKKAIEQQAHLKPAFEMLGAVKDKKIVDMTPVEYNQLLDAVIDVHSKWGVQGLDKNAAAKLVSSASLGNKAEATAKEALLATIGETPAKSISRLGTTLSEYDVPLGQGADLRKQIGEMKGKIDLGELDRMLQPVTPDHPGVMSELINRSEDTPLGKEALQSLKDIRKGRGLMDVGVKAGPFSTSIVDVADLAAFGGRRMEAASKEALKPENISKSMLTNPGILTAMAKNKGEMGKIATEALQSLQERGLDGLKSRAFLMQSNPTFRAQLAGKQDRSEALP